MADFTAPSFSLGLDFDLDLDQSNIPNQHSPVLVDLISSQSIQEDDDFETLISDVQQQADDDDTPPILKRLKRGLPASVAVQKLRLNHDDKDDDEIEDDPTPTTTTTDDHSAHQNHSACSSSKFPSHGFVPLNAQFTSKSKGREQTQASNASSYTRDKSNNNIMFPKLTIIPLRRFQLLDSDSDSDNLSSSEDLFEDNKTVGISPSKRRRNANGKPVINHQERDTVARSKLQTKDLWKDLCPQKSMNIPTPALDDFCDEYFRPVKDKNIHQTKDKYTYDVSPKVCEQDNIIGENAELFKNLNRPLPPAYKYFYHDDPRIKSLIRSRLPNFFPLGVNKEIPESEPADIDYMCQFNQKEPTPRSKVIEGISGTVKKSINQSNGMASSEISGSWVNPKGCTGKCKNTGSSQGLVSGHSSATPKNAGKRRVRAVGSSSGSWFTEEGGRKVYVAKNGQELSGRVAYCQYKKEMGIGFKKSRKKAASKKKKSKH